MKIKHNLKIKKCTLSNGLKVVLVKTNTKRKLAAVVIKKGNDAFPGTIDNHQVPDGIAHFLEHRMFDLDCGKDALQEFEKLGVDANAETSNDYTSYYFEAVNNFEEGLKLLLNITCKMNFLKESVDKEKPIIIEEIHGRENHASAQAFDALMKNMFAASPLRNRVIGSSESVQNTTFEDLKRFYETFYALEKLTLFLVGDIENSILEKIEAFLPAKVAQSTHKYYSKKLKKDGPKVIKNLEVINFPVVSTLVNIGFKICGETLKTLGMTYVELERALSLLDELCFSSSSPFEEYLRKTEFSGLTISNFYVTYKEDGAYCFSFLHEKHQEVITLIKQYFSECVSQIKEHDLEIIKKQVLGEWVINMHKSDAIYDHLINALDFKFDFVKRFSILFDITFEQVMRIIKIIPTLDMSVVLIKDKK